MYKERLDHQINHGLFWLTISIPFPFTANPKTYLDSASNYEGNSEPTNTKIHSIPRIGSTEQHLEESNLGSGWGGVPGQSKKKWLGLRKYASCT